MTDNDKPEKLKLLDFGKLLPADSENFRLWLGLQFHEIEMTLLQCAFAYEERGEIIYPFEGTRDELYYKKDKHNPDGISILLVNDERDFKISSDVYHFLQTSLYLEERNADEILASALQDLNFLIDPISKRQQKKLKDDGLEYLRKCILCCAKALFLCRSDKYSTLTGKEKTILFMLQSRLERKTSEAIIYAIIKSPESKTKKEAGAKRKTWHGLTKEQIDERDNNFFEMYQKRKIKNITSNSFAKAKQKEINDYCHKKYPNMNPDFNLKWETIRKIIDEKLQQSCNLPKPEK